MINRHLTLFIKLLYLIFRIYLPITFLYQFVRGVKNAVRHFTMGAVNEQLTNYDYGRENKHDLAKDQAQQLLLIFLNRATLTSALPCQWKTGRASHWPVTLELKQFTPLYVNYWNSLKRSFREYLQSVSDSCQTLHYSAI